MEGYEHLEGYTEEQLWEQYTETKEQSIRNYFIEKYANLVKYVAGRAMTNVPPSVDFNDLVSFGVWGLIDAIDKFDLSRDIKFKTYAVTRIRGTIFDELRNLNWSTKSKRCSLRDIEDIENSIIDIEYKFGRKAKKTEVAKDLGMSVKDLQNVLSYIDKETAMKYLSAEYEDWFGKGFSIAPNSCFRESLDSTEKQKKLQEIITQDVVCFTDQEKKILLLYYFEKSTLKDIGEVLDMTELDVNILLTMATMHLKEILND